MEVELRPQSHRKIKNNEYIVSHIYERIVAHTRLWNRLIYTEEMIKDEEQKALEILKNNKPLTFWCQQYR